MVHRDTKNYWKSITINKNTKNKYHPTSSLKINNYFLNKLELKKKNKILDIGCGYGRFFPQYLKKGLNITGIDIDQNMLKNVKKDTKFKKIKIINGNFIKYSFKKNYFDNLVCWASLDEMNQNKFFEKSKEILKVGGSLLITGKNSHYFHNDKMAFLAEENSRKKNHKNYFTNLNLINFNELGFKIKNIYYFKKRGDFSKRNFVIKKPKYFYEYLLIAKKLNKKKIKVNKNIFHTHSKTWLEKKINFRFNDKIQGFLNNKVFFISGLYRSGTSIITQLIGSHPKVFLTYDSIKYSRFNLNKKINKKNISTIVNETYDRLFYRWKIKLDKSKIYKKLDKLKNINHSNLYYTMMNEMKNLYKPNAKIVGEKVALEWRFIPNFLKMFPNGKIIHIIRDPRDVVASFKKITFEKKDEYMNTVFNAFAAMNEIKYIQEYFGPNKILIIKLEDLLENKHLILDKISNFLNINYDDENLNFKNYKTKNGESWSGNSNFSKNKAFLKNSKRWKKYLNKKEVYFIEHVLKNSMNEYGYELNKNKITQNEIMKAMVFLKNKNIMRNYLDYLSHNKGIQKYSSDPVALEISIVKNLKKNNKY